MKKIIAGTITILLILLILFFIFKFNSIEFIKEIIKNIKIYI